MNSCVVLVWKVSTDCAFKDNSIIIHNSSSPLSLLWICLLSWCLSCSKPACLCLGYFPTPFLELLLLKSVSFNTITSAVLLHFCLLSPDSFIHLFSGVWAWSRPFANQTIQHSHHANVKWQHRYVCTALVLIVKPSALLNSLAYQLVCCLLFTRLFDVT